MTTQLIASIAGILLIVSSATAILIELDRPDARISLLGYILQYFGICLLFINIFPLQIIIALLLTGIMGAAILGTDQINLKTRLVFSGFRSDNLFRFLLAILIAVLIFAIEPKISRWIPIPAAILFSALFLMAIGLILFSQGRRLLNRFIGILNIFLGFQATYMLIEESVLVTGFMIAINLLISLLGAFLMSTQSHDAESPE
jgi:hypothetical protein